MDNNPENPEERPNSEPAVSSLIESLFADQDRHSLSDQNMFVGGDNFLHSLDTDTTPTPATNQALNKIKKVISSCILVLLVAIIAIVAYPMLKPPQSTSPIASYDSLQTNTFNEQSSVNQDKTGQPAVIPTLKMAESLFANESYEQAYEVYEGVRILTTQNSENEMLFDFIWLRMGQLHKQQGQLLKANQLLRAAAKASSPIIKIIANYELAQNYVDQKLFLQARTSAYKAIAIADAVKYNQEWIEVFKSNCHFITSEAMTRYTLTLSDADETAPDKLRKYSYTMADPFANIDSGQLRLLLESGSEKLSKSLSAPIIKEIPSSSPSSHFSVTCYNTSIEEVVAKFATKSGLEINGTLGNIPTAENPEDYNATTLVTMYLPDVTVDDFISFAVGSTGLAAEWQDNRTVNIYNPSNYESLSDYIKQLNHESVDLWQKIILTYQDENYLPGAHFALALLYSLDEKISEAIAEYRLVANCFPNTNLAKLSLLYSAKLKNKLHDYTGAQKDLKQLVEQYPGSKIAGQALLYLADSTLKTMQYQEARRLYNKVYFFTSDTETQTNAAFGAGKASYALKDNKSALKWLSKFIKHTRDTEHPDIYFACHLLGKIYYELGDLQQACIALQCALAGTLSKEDSVSAVKMLVDGYIQQEDFVQALHVLEDRHLYSLASEKYDERLLIKSKTLRSIGLFDNDITTIKNRLEYIVDPTVKAKLMFELALCYRSKDELEAAREFSMQALDLSDSEELSQTIACELADICLELEYYNQVVTMCTYILESSAEKQLRGKAENLIAHAYYYMDDFDNALSALAEPNDTEAELNASSDTNKVAKSNILKNNLQ